MSVRVASVAAGLICTLLHAAPARADGCEQDPCRDFAVVRDVAPASSAEVPTDGVLVLAIAYTGELASPDIRERVALTVSLDDAPVAGALAGVDIDDLLIWRPAAPLQPGARYQVTGSVGNPPTGEPGCDLGERPIAFEFTAAAGPAAPLAGPELVVQSTYFDDPVLSLTTAVCCNDAMAADQLVCGVSEGITWAKGVCAATSSRGWLRVLATAPTAADPASAGQWVRVLLQDGEAVQTSIGASFQRELDAPACLAIVQRSLATGESRTSAEQCLGDDRAGELGVRDVDPSAAGTYLARITSFGYTGVKNTSIVGKRGTIIHRHFVVGLIDTFVCIEPIFIHRLAHF